MATKRQAKANPEKTTFTAKHDAPITSSAMDDESVDVFQLRESNVSLYRYEGFALHAMLKKQEW